MADKLYAKHKNGGLFIISYDVERDASMAKMTVDEYISEIEKLNPQLTKVYTV